MIQFHWHTEPTLIILLLTAGWLYTVLVIPMRSRFLTASSKCPWGSLFLFLAGLVLTYLTVGSPLDQIGEDYLFSAHMIQHILLIYVIPVFFYLGLPDGLVDSVLKISFIQKGFRPLVHPLTAGILFTGCFTIWHIPVLYEWALRSKPMHILEHWMMFGSAMLMWWTFLSPSGILPARSYPVRMITVFLLMVAQLPVFGFLTFSGEVLYPTYAYAARLDFFNISPLEDQTLGGVIMKIANMVFSLTALIICFYLWVGQDQKESERAGAQI